MHHIIYLSRVSQKPNPEELVALLVKARSSNEVAGITGAMVYGQGQFIQILEGEEAAVTALYERIVADPRHQAILKLADKPITERTFVKWSMAFRELSPEQAAELVGYTSPAQWEQTFFPGDSPDGLLLNRMRDVVLLPSVN
jgi:hypothetical protein